MAAPKSLLRIRRFQPRDRAAIERIGQQIVENGTVFPFRSLQGVCDYWFGSPQSECYVAVLKDEHHPDGDDDDDDDERLIGSYVFKPVMPDRCAHIANAGFMVDSVFSGQGFGKQMAEHSLETCRRAGYHGMQFNVVVCTNLGAIKLWKKLGFRQIGTVPSAFERDDGFVDLTIWFRELKRLDEDEEASFDQDSVNPNKFQGT